MYYITSLDQESKQCEVHDFFTIGSSQESHLKLENLSEKHARIERKDNKYLLRDLRTTKGTYLNGSQILEGYLQPGDLIRVGDFEFAFEKRSQDTDLPLLSSYNIKWNKNLKKLPQVAQTEFPILLLGESGSGKEILAHEVHRKSARKRGPFISVNCSALSESLVESELFGHMKGSFTGSTENRKGAFQAAKGGTLFLDEIGDLPLSLQPKLLRALENHEIRPVGCDHNIQTNVRIVVATHKNLRRRVLEGRFREDLYFRLNVLKFEIPALRMRMEDFEKFLFYFAKKGHVSFSYSAVQALKFHSWPGNIRELKNTVSRASALFPNTQIQPNHLEFLIDPISKTSLEKVTPIIKQVERDLIIEKLKNFHGNQRRTAESLGIPRSTMNDRIKAYGINIKELVHRSQKTKALSKGF